MRTLTSAALLLAALASGLTAQSAPVPDRKLGLRDIFELEWAADPRIAPDGRRVVFERGGYDVMKDRARSTLWIVNADGSQAELYDLATDGNETNNVSTANSQLAKRLTAAALAWKKSLPRLVE